jgi:hypothetical protein
MTEGTWYIDPDAGPVAADDDETYDEAYGPGDPDEADGRLVDEDDAKGTSQSEVYGAVAAGDTAWKSAEESAVHVVDEEELAEQDAWDADAAPTDLD